MTVRVMYAEAVMSDDAILLKLEEDFTCPITQACLLTCTYTPLEHSSLALTGACSLACLAAVNVPSHAHEDAAAAQDMTDMCELY